MYVNRLPAEVRFAGARSPAVLVLGMHRSGTSSLTGALIHLGGAAPAHIMPAMPDNERGFWESSAVMALNDEILSAGKSEWTDWRRFDLDCIDAGALETFHSRAAATLAAEFGGAPIPVVKDPRICRLMDFWAPVFDEIGWAARVVLPVRSPLEVAWSLDRRNRIHPSIGCLIWLRHVLEAEAATRELPRVVLDWTTFLRNRRGTLASLSARLELDWPRWSEEGLEAVDAFVSDDLRHCEADATELGTHPAVSALAREVYDEMLKLARDPDIRTPLSRLDDLRARFESSAALFDRAMGDLEHEVRDLRQRQIDEESDFARQLAAAQAAFEAAERARAAADDRLAAAQADLAARLDAAERERAEAAAATDDRLAAAQRAFEAAERKRDAVRAKLTRAEALIVRLGQRPPSKVPAKTRLARLAFWKRRRTPFGLETIRASALFDPEWYLAANPDVQKSGADPAWHYLAHGAAEGRDPGPIFSTAGYFSRNPDVAEAGKNPLLHYETMGRMEGRSPFD